MGLDLNQSLGNISDPVVSIIIPTYRREQQVVEAIKSVLSECSLPLEILVFDDSPEASAKEAVAGIDDERVRYAVMPMPSGGRPAVVRNLGMQRARGSYLYFLDDDDRIAPRGIDVLASALDEHPQQAVAFGNVECVGPHAATRDRYNAWFTWASHVAQRYAWSSRLTAGIIMFRGTLIINSACLIRRSEAMRLGGYDPAIPYYEDVEFFTRAIRRGGHVYVNHPVLIYGTGQPSLIHDLDGDVSAIQDSYRQMHAKYRATYGDINYRLLQILSKLLPLGSPHESAAAASRAR